MGSKHTFKLDSAASSKLSPHVRGSRVCWPALTAVSNTNKAW